MTEEIKDRLYAAVGSELSTAYFYARAEIVAVGRMMAASAEEFGTHKEDELKHAKQFAERLYELGGTIPFQFAELPGIADCPFPDSPADECETQLTNWLWDKAEDMERCSVEKYTELAQLTADCDPATNDLVCGILRKELQHLTDAKKFSVSMGGTLGADTVECGKCGGAPAAMGETLTGSSGLGI